MAGGDAGVWFNLGAAQSRAGKFEEAASSLGRSLVIDPDNPLAWCHQGAALTHLGRLEEAVSAFGKALAGDESLEAAWFHLGIAQEGLARYEDAAESFRRALEINARNGDAWYHAGGALYHLGRADEALRAFERSTKSLPATPGHGTTWGCLLSEAGGVRIRGGRLRPRPRGRSPLRRSPEQPGECPLRARQGPRRLNPLLSGPSLSSPPIPLPGTTRPSSRSSAGPANRPWNPSGMCSNWTRTIRAHGTPRGSSSTPSGGTARHSRRTHLGHQPGSRGRACLVPGGRPRGSRQARGGDPVLRACLQYRSRGQPRLVPHGVAPGGPWDATRMRRRPSRRPSG